MKGLLIFLFFTSVAYADYKVDRTGQKITIDDMAYYHALNEGLVEILMQAQSEAVRDEDGTIIGWELFDFTERSIFHVVGIKEGDVITHVDDIQLDSPAVAVHMLKWARYQDEVSFTLIRRGKKLVFNVSIK